MAYLGSTDIYLNDPKTIGGWIYEIAIYFPGIGIIVAPICVLFLAYFLIKRKWKEIDKLSLYVFIIGIALNIIFQFFDPGNYNKLFELVF